MAGTIPNSWTFAGLVDAPKTMGKTFKGLKDSVLSREVWDVDGDAVGFFWKFLHKGVPVPIAKNGYNGWIEAEPEAELERISEAIGAQPGLSRLGHSGQFTERVKEYGFGSYGQLR